MAVITDLITGANVEAITVNDVYGLAERIVEQVIEGADISFKYPELNRTISEWGSIIGTARIPATESRTVDPETMTKNAPAYPTPSVLYFNEWTEKVYPAEWRRIDASKVLSGDLEFAAFVAKVVNANLEGYRKDVNLGIKKVLSYATNETPAKFAEVIIDTTTATAPTVSTNAKSILGNMGQYEVLENATFDDVYTEIMRISELMQFDNDDFSGSFVCGANRDDLVIYAPVDFMASQSIEYKTRLRQLESFRDLPEIKTTDGNVFEYTDGEDVAQKKCVILIQDKRFLSHVERWRETQAGYDRERKSEYNDLHVEDAIIANTLYKAYAIVFDLPKVQNVNVKVNGSGVIV